MSSPNWVRDFVILDPEPPPPRNLTRKARPDLQHGFTISGMWRRRRDGQKNLGLKIKPFDHEPVCPELQLPHNVFQ